MEKLVHIIPLGWEYDRVVLPLESMKAHKAYVLVRAEGRPVREHYARKLERWANKNGVKLEFVEIDSFRDLAGIMNSISKIILSELEEGNRVYVNVSTSGKVAAIGATLAAMAHLPPSRGMVYYVAALDYPTDLDAQREHGIAKGMDGDPIPLPIFPLALPDLACSVVLSDLARAGKSVSYGDLIRSLSTKGIDPFKISDSTPLRTRLDRGKTQVAFHRQVVAKLSSQGVVTIQKAGRARLLELTDAGRQLAALSVIHRN